MPDSLTVKTLDQYLCQLNLMKIHSYVFGLDKRTNQLGRVYHLGKGRIEAQHGSVLE